MLASAVLGASPVHAAQVGGKRAAFFMPFGNGGVTGDESPLNHATQSTADYGFAWDLHGGTSAAVYPKVTSNDGTVSMQVESFTPRPAGYLVIVKVKVDNVDVGKLAFSHLVNLGVGNGQPVTADTRLGDTAPNIQYGGCVGFPCSGSWQVGAAAGIHTHVAFSKACFGPQGINQPVGANDALALLSQNYPAGFKAGCDPSELASVGSAYAPVVFTRPNGETDVIVVTSTNKLVYYFIGAGSSQWNKMDITGDQQAYSTPAVALRPNGELCIVVRTASNGLGYHFNAQGSPTWNHLYFANGGAYGNPDMLLRPNGELNVVVRGPNNSLNYFFNSLGNPNWDQITIPGGGAVSDPTIARRPNGEINVVVGGPNNQLDYYYISPGSQTWNRVTIDAVNTAMQKPVIIQRPGGELDIVTVTGNHGLNFYYNPAGWVTFGKIEVPNSEAYSTPAVALRPSGEVNIVVMGANQKMDFYYNAQGSPTWGKLPIAVANMTKSAPSMIQRANGETDVVVMNSAYQTDYFMNDAGSILWGRMTLP